MILSGHWERGICALEFLDFPESGKGICMASFCIKSWRDWDGGGFGSDTELNDTGDWSMGNGRFGVAFA